MFRKHLGWGMFLAGFLQAGSFQEPSGLYRLTFPENWEVRVLQQEGNQVYALQRTPNYDATVLVDVVLGRYGESDLAQYTAYLQGNFPGLSPLGPWKVRQRGALLRAVQDFREEAQGKTTRVRAYATVGPYFSVVLLAITAEKDFPTVVPEFERIARSLRLASPDPAAQARLAGTWVAASGYQDYMNEFSSYAEWSYTFTPDGRFSYGGAVMADNPGVSAMGSSDQSGTFFVIGNRVVLLYADGTTEVLTYTEGMLVDENGRRYVPNP